MQQLFPTKVQRNGYLRIQDGTLPLHTASAENCSGCRSAILISKLRAIELTGMEIKHQCFLY
jgi:hypothetical protein